MKRILFICIALTAFLFSCSKDETPVETCRNSGVSVEPSSFFTLPSAVGTYWVYDYYRVNELGVSTPTWNRDTVTIVGDSVVNGEVYQKYENLRMVGSNSNISLRRLINGTVYNEEGTKIYSIAEFNQEFNLQTIEIPQGEFLNRHEIMVDKRDEVVSVPFGDFNSVDRESRHFYDGYPVLNACGETEIVYHLYISDGIGEVKQVIAFITSTFQTCEYIERRLVEFYEP